MRRVLIVLAMLSCASAANAMSVATFISKADALQKRGPLALLSSDYGALKGELTNSMLTLRAERLAAEKRGQTPAYCPREQKGSMTLDEVMGAMNAVPPAQRSSASVVDALRAHLAKRFPCKK